MENGVKKSENSKQILSILFIITSLTLISFLMKYLSELTHEFLGHCCFGYILGATSCEYYVSWIWPIEFGYASVFFEEGTSNTIYAIIMSGGIIVCLFVALSSQLITYFIYRRKKVENLYLLILFHLLFWYGFWAFMNSTGYLIVGGLLNFGDIGKITYYSNVPSWFFIIIGIIVFLIQFYLFSINWQRLTSVLMTTDPKFSLSFFWLLIPFVYILFVLNPEINIPLKFIFFGLVPMLLPSVFSYLSLHFEWPIWGEVNERE